MRSFLTDLAKGHTLVLLGSRSSEDWLAKGTFDDNIYELPGLDPEAATTLADRILERNNATKYRQDEDIRKLIKVLDGFPLALEVVLANLTHQTPTEVLAALQAGDVSIDPKSDSQDKTESILRCIDYSHSNLSTEAQQLLLCLAPFTSVIWLDYLDEYTNQLRKQPVLESLPFDHCSEVLQEAMNWGLLSPDTNNPRFLRLQPIFPYFLRNRLYMTEQGEVRSAVETAFREHYDQIGFKLKKLFDSKYPLERQMGQKETRLEYENLITALNLALAEQVSVGNIYFALSTYLDTIQEHHCIMELGLLILEAFEIYPTEKLFDQLGIEHIRVIGTIASCHYRLKQYAKAEALVDNMLKLINQLEYIDEKTRKKLKAMTFHQLGTVFQGQRKWELANQYYQQALQIYIDLNDSEMQAQIYRQLGTWALEQQQWTRAEQCYRWALNIYNDSNNYEAQAATFHQLARVAQERRQWQQAELYFQQALQISIIHNFHYDQGRIYHNLGGVAQEQRQWQRAEQYYQKALQIFIEYKDRHLQAKTYHQLGMVAFEQQQLMQAEQYYKQALQIFIEYNDRHAQASALFHLGIVVHEQCQWQLTDQYYRQALQIYIEYNDRYEQARIDHQLGNLALGQHQLMQAEQHYQQALQIDIEYNDRYSQAKTYGQLGLLEQERKRWSQASDYLIRTLEIFITFEDEHNLEITIINLARLWKASDDISIPVKVSTTLGVSEEEIETLFRKIVEEE